jgi:hypothetical protein
VDILAFEMEAAVLQRPSKSHCFSMALGFALSPALAVGQPQPSTTELERLFLVEIAALLCEVELTDDTEDALDAAIQREQRRLGLTKSQVAAVYNRVRRQVVATPDLDCEGAGQLDPAPVEPDDG